MSSGFGLPAIDFQGGLAQIGRTLALSSEQQRKRELAQALGTSLQAGDYAGAAKVAFEAGEPDTGLGILKYGLTADQQKRANAASDWWNQGISGGAPSPISALGALYGASSDTPDPSRAVPSFADSSGPAGGYLANLTRRESNDNPNARNPNSTATGLGQFTEGTWRDLARRQPGLGLTPDGRTDPKQAMRATAAFTAENEAILNRANLPVNDATRYAVHFLGQRGGPAFIARSMQNPDAPAASLVQPDQVRANRNVFFNRDGSPKSARQVFADIGRSFGGGGGTAPAPARSQVAYADDEAQTQALEQRMGMYPTQTAQADMPVAGGRAAAFYIPGTDPSAIQPALKQGPFGGTAAPRGEVLPPSRDLGVPARSRTMTLPGAPVGAEAPSAAGGAVGGAVGNVPAATIAATPLAQRIPFLMKAAGHPDLPAPQREIAQMLLKQALDETRMPDTVKEFVWARANGMTRAANPAAYAREKSGPTKLSPGESIYDEGSGEIRITAPDRNRSNVADDVDARRQAAEGLGLTPGSPSYQSYVLTGKMPREDQQPLSASDKKAILEADDAVTTAETAIGNLQEAKKLSKQAYEGPTAGARGQLTGYFGSKEGLATIDLDNLVTTNALGQLKAIFGAAPTEGERKILLDIQGSSSLPDAARQRIYDRAIALAERRLDLNRQRASEMRGQTYFKPDGGPQGSGGRGGARALPAPSPSNRPGAATPADRFQQLMGSGLSKQQAYERLQQEGY